MKKDKLLSLFLAILNILILIILITIYGIPNNHLDIHYNISSITFVAFITSIFSIICLIIAKVKWNNLSFIYLLFYIIFLFGNVFCKYIFNFTNIDADNIARVLGDNSNLIRAIVLSLYCMIGMNIGTLICMTLKRNTSKIKIPKTKPDNLYYMRITAYIVTLISAPFAIFILAQDLSLAFLGGYKAVYSFQTIGINSIMNNLAVFFYIGQLLLLISYKENKKKAKTVFLITALYSSLKIILGARGLPLLELFFLIIVWDSCIKKIGKKIFIIAIISIVPISMLISIMKVARKIPVSDWTDNINVIVETSLQSNPILTTVSEMGGAIFPTAGSINVYPDIYNYRYGLSYLYGVKALIPNLSTTKINVNVKYVIAQEVSDYYEIPFGGSVVEDLYGNFGFFAVFAIAIIGYLLCYSSLVIFEKRDQKPFQFALYMAISVQIVWTVRNTISPIIGYVFRYCLIVYILYKLVCKYFQIRKVR